MEYKALYRRFRPMTFGEILGQDHITTTLRNQVIAGRVGHAYLFTGVRGCGKTTSAKVLARAINCLNPKDGEPCNECDICKAQMEGSLTDVVEMDAASNNGVDDIRAIRDEVNFLPTVAKYRVYIIDEVHMLSTGAFNALLKTLEEPPAHVKFILCTTEPQKLPATILSRCQRFDFKKISSEKIVENLDHICKECGINYSGKSLELIAELSEGAMRDSLSILERCVQDGENEISEDKIKQLVGIPEIEITSGLVEAIINTDPTKALDITQAIIDEGKNTINLLWEMIKYVRNLMLFKATKQASNVYNENEVKKITELSEKVDKERLLNIVFELSKLENDLRYSSQKNIVFQVGILKLCSDDEETVVVKRTKVVETESKPEAKPVVKATTPKVEPVAKPAKEAIKVETVTTPVKGEAPFWGKVIQQLREEQMPAVASALTGTHGFVIDDLTFGISGIDAFKKMILEKPENIGAIKRLVSVECKNDMRIKFIDQPKNEDAKKDNGNSINLGIDINVID